MARVETDGPFSKFSGIDRTLAILDGDGLILTIDGGEVELTSTAAPLSFDGEATASARLRGGAVLDLNLMTRRARYAHRMTPLYSRRQHPSPYRRAILSSSRRTALSWSRPMPASCGLRRATRSMAVRSARHGGSRRGASRVYVLEILDLAARLP